MMGKGAGWDGAVGLERYGRGAQGLEVEGDVNGREEG